MSDLLSGVRVVELAQWVMVPSAGALLADLGADVIKIEHPIEGDPYRGLTTFVFRDGSDGESPSVAHTNRGKRSLGVDVKTAGGREIVARLVRDSDVFLTSWREPALERLGLDWDSLRLTNPSLVYVRGNAFGTEGPDRDAPGYDATAYWSRGGFAFALTAPGASYPVQMRPALGDRTTAMALAMGVCAAFIKKERTGIGSRVDVSLMGTAGWVLAGDLLAAKHGVQAAQESVRSRNTNPLTNVFRTRDGRWIQLNGLQPDRYWSDLCRVLERPDLGEDQRFSDATTRAANSTVCLEQLDGAFAQRDYEDWKQRFQSFTGPWAPVQGTLEIVDDPQTRANGWVVELEGEDRPVYAVASPLRVDGDQDHLRRAPVQAENTEEILLEMGISWEEIAELKADGAIS